MKEYFKEAFKPYVYFVLKKFYPNQYQAAIMNDIGILLAKRARIEVEEAREKERNKKKLKNIKIEIDDELNKM